MSLYIKDPNAVLDYAFDWKPYTNGVTGATSDWLASGETISSHTVTVEAGLTKDSDSESSGKVTVWLSGGTAGTWYTVACKIVTSASRTDERTMQIQVKNR
jgi:hypothetical protein